VSGDLGRLRGKIDDIDAGIIALLGERFKLTRRVGQLKASGGLASLDATREQAQDARYTELAADANVDADLVRQVFDDVRATVRHEHEAAGAQMQSHPRAGH